MVPVIGRSGVRGIPASWFYEQQRSFQPDLEPIAGRAGKVCAGKAPGRGMCAQLVRRGAGIPIHRAA